MNPIPEVAAALVCQVLITDSASSSKTLANVFSKLQIPIPASTGMGLFVRMIDGQGTYNARIRLVRIHDDRILVDFQLPNLSWPDRLEPVEIGLNFQLLPIDEEGMHEFQIFMDEIYVGRASFQVEKITLSSSTGGTS